VAKGRHIGSSLGFPTANLIPQKGKLLPPNGVYATRTMVDGDSYLSITNVGTNPTVSDDCHKTIETNILDFDSDIYDKTITVEFMERIRGEKRFDSLDILKKQIKKDVDYVKNKYKLL